MKLPSSVRALALGSVSLLGILSAAQAQLIPVSVTATGTYNNSASLLTDGFTPVETTRADDASVVWWTASATPVHFTIDFGAAYNLTSFLVAVDNNDTYNFEYSLDGLTYTSLFTVNPLAGETTFGIDVFSTSVSHVEFDASIATAPVNARYIRTNVWGGDNFYAIGEIEAWGDSFTPGPGPLPASVPEPSTYGVIGAALLLGLITLKRDRLRF